MFIKVGTEYVNTQHIAYVEIPDGSEYIGIYTTDRCISLSKAQCDRLLKYLDTIAIKEDNSLNAIRLVNENDNTCEPTQDTGQQKERDVRTGADGQNVQG